jgi:hypothetical protein
VRSLLIIGLLAASAHADPTPPSTAEPQPRWLITGQIGTGAADLDNIEFAQSWSLGAGVRFLPKLYLVGRLRHTSPVHGGLPEQAFREWLLGEDLSDITENPDRRIHQTDLAVGVRVRGKSLWAEALIGGQLRYLIGGQGGFDNRSSLIVDTAIGVQLTKSSRRDSPQRAGRGTSPSASGSIDGGMFVGAGIDPLSGRFARTLLGFEITADFM